MSENIRHHLPKECQEKNHMEFVYETIKILAFTINFCVAIFNIRKALDSWLNVSLQQILEDRRMTTKELMILHRRGEYREVE
jgi:hypothetical protein